MSTLRTFNLQHPESSNNNIQLAEGGGVSVTAGILTATNVSSTNVTTTEVTATNGTFSGNLSVGGTLTYEDVTNIDAVGIITANAGIHLDDVLSHKDNTNTKIRFPAADTITAETAATERLRITSNGRIGIATDNPQAILDVEGTLVVGTSGVANGNTTLNGHVIVDRTGVSGSNPSLSVYSSGSSVFYVNGGGSVYASGVNATGGITAGTSGQGDGNSNIYGYLSVDRNGVAASNTWFQVKNGSTPIIYANGQGKFGVGTNSPSVNLHVKGSASNGQIYLGGTGAHSQIYADNDGALILNADQGNSAANSYLGFNVDNTEKLRITSTGDVNIPGGILNLGTADVSSGHINSYELMSFNIDTDNDDGNRYFIFKKDAATADGTELMRLTEGGNLGIGGVDPATGDGGNSNYNNWDTPKLHVKGATTSGKFHLLGRFVSGVDADSTGAQIVIHHENDRGMALQGGRSSGNRSYGAIKSLDNLARESNVMVFSGGEGQGVDNIKFYTNGLSTGTNERMAINTYGTVHTGGSDLITQTTLKPDLITRAGVMSPLFWRPFGGLTSGPSTDGPGYLDLQSGGVRHNLTDPHLGAGLGGSQFQGGLINSYSQTFSNTASGTTRESIEWNRFRILFRGVCPGSGYSVATVKFRYSTYHYSNGWQDHAGTEWTYTGTEQVRGGRWVVGPWINPSSYFTNWADVPGFALYYNDNGSGRNFRIAGGVYYQYAYFQ